MVINFDRMTPMPDTDLSDGIFAITLAEGAIDNRLGNDVFWPNFSVYCCARVAVHSLSRTADWWSNPELQEFLI